MGALCPKLWAPLKLPPHCLRLLSTLLYPLQKGSLPFLANAFSTLRYWGHRVIIPKTNKDSHMLIMSYTLTLKSVSL